MKNLLKGFKMPTGITFEPSSENKFQGTFVAYPFVRGMGTTVANSLRRTLLSSIQGYAVTAIRCSYYHDDGTSRVIASEFEAIPEVVEDTIDIISALKQLRVSLSEEEEQHKVTVSVKGETVLSGKDFSFGNIEILTPDLVLLHANKDAHFDLEVQFTHGRGYVPAEEHETEDELGIVPIDALFSPIKQVHYNVTNTRVGRHNDYEKIELTIVTDGTISPADALGEAAKIIKDHFTVFINFDEQSLQNSSESLEELNRKKILESPIEELELSVRSSNCLRSVDILTVGELTERSVEEIAGIKNFGKKSLDEIVEKLTRWGFSLKSSGRR